MPDDKPINVGPTVDELVEQAAAGKQASARLPEILASTTGVAFDPRKLVQATTTASGELRGLALHPAAMSFGGEELGRMVLAAAQQATEFAKQRCFNELAVVLGDTAMAEVEDMIGPSPARAAGWDLRRDPGDLAAPAQPPAETADGAGVEAVIDEDDPLSFDPSTLRSDR